MIFLTLCTVFAHGPDDGVLEKLTQQIKASPENAKLYLQRALINERHEDWKACEEDLLKAQTLQADLTDFNYFMGRVAMGQAKDQRAIEYFDKSLKQNPKDFEILFAKGRAYFSLKKYSLAAASFDQAFENPKDPLPNHVIERVQAHQLASSSNVAAITQIIRQALEQFGPLLMLQIELYNLQYKSGKYTHALLTLDQILENVSRKEKWLIEKARCYIALKQNEKAAENLKTVDQIFEKMPKVIKKRKLISDLIQQADKLKSEL
ncbi:MAG: tetratricopeptide repeat protein [Lentisphaerales bacterium]|nr:tetratricopeptide repeat protein [Lentisphaerales bacterium]